MVRELVEVTSRGGGLGVQSWGPSELLPFQEEGAHPTAVAQGHSPPPIDFLFLPWLGGR